ncbi:hypothetical protein ACO2Q3_11315 [Caulobacter sp. KR2-114]|uniref:hypothetical protein n=1 Tax=Caulobacter sp. KR2-114 TaxID=3400912 RepID=UPI003C0E9C7F
MINATLCQADFYNPKIISKSGQNGFKKFRVVTVPAGTLLFKMTKGVAAAGQYGVSPWWSAVKPFLDDKEGALGRLNQAKANQISMTAMVRFMSCVCLDWNDLDNYVQIKLLDDAKVFWGTFNPMPKFSQELWKPDWANPNEEGSGAKALARVKLMQMKEKQAGFAVPDVLGGPEAWQMYIPNLKEEHIARESVISGHDMAALSMALGF